MQDQPNANQTSTQKETVTPPSGGGDHIVITGNIGPGASIGRGSVQSNHIAGNDLVINNGIVSEGQAQFSDLLADLKDMILQAREKGELNGTLATQAVEQLETAADMVKKKKKEDKPILVQKLEAVADLIEDAVETFSANDGGIATILVKALPIAAILVKLATHLF